MRARLLACLPMVFALSGCDPLGSGGSLLGPGGGLTLTPWNWLSTGVKLQGPRSFDLRMRVGEDRHFVADITRPDFTHVRWTVGGFDGQGRMDLMGFACVPSDACGIESVVPDKDGRLVGRLSVHGATQVTVRVAALTSGRSIVSVVGSKEVLCPNQAPQARPGCELYADDAFYFPIDP
jgi:hypothetical protein